jgi:hypothetical protein
VNRPPLHSIGQIVGMLADRADQLAAELLPGGRREGREWVAGDLSGGPGRGVSVCISGGKAGTWADFQGGQSMRPGKVGGDMLDLIAMTRTGRDKGEALKWARGWLGLSSERAREAPPPPPRPRADPAPEQARRRAQGIGLFSKALRWPGTPVEHYLAGRAIRLSELQHVPAALRYDPECFCPERQRPGPAMLACIMRGADVIGVHRTWLERYPTGWGKAPLKAEKKVLGQQQGGYIPLARGSSGEPLKRAPAGDVVAIAEGIEDALSIAVECPEWRVLACINVGNMAMIDLPAGIAEVVLCLDRDGENPASRRAIEAAIARFTREGRQVRATRPPEGFKDFNEWRQSLAREGAGRLAQGRNAG